mgnify:CR=1 FL=1
MYVNTVKKAKKLLSYPKLIGRYEDKPIILNKGKFGFYLQYDGKNLIIRYPRDIFDKNDRFTTPPIKNRIQISFQKSWQKSLQKSVNFFIDQLFLNQKFSLSIRYHF